MNATRLSRSRRNKEIRKRRIRRQNFEDRVIQKKPFQLGGIKVCQSGIGLYESENDYPFEKQGSDDKEGQQKAHTH